MEAAFWAGSGHYTSPEALSYLLNLSQLSDNDGAYCIGLFVKIK